MAATASPFGLRPTNMLGGTPNHGGAMREFPVKANNTAGIFFGDEVLLTTAGLPVAATATPVAVEFTATSTNATAGVMGVCVGVRYVDANGVQQFAQHLPANATTAGFTDIFVRVNDDPRQLYQIQGSAALGTFNSGTDGSGFAGAVGKNAALGNYEAQSTSTGLSGINLVVGSNGGSLAVTETLAMRIVEVVGGTENDNFPEFIVKFNFSVLSSENNLGI